jgi:hypothetical protein
MRFLGVLSLGRAEDRLFPGELSIQTGNEAAQLCLWCTLAIDMRPRGDMSKTCAISRYPLHRETCTDITQYGGPGYMFERT